jgi:putative addiction module component (TIGR02574 family)
MSVIDDLLNRALELSEPDRADLARRLLLSLETEEFDADRDTAWAAELEVRLEKVDKDQFTARDWREVIANLQKSLTKGTSS